MQANQPSSQALIDRYIEKNMPFAIISKEGSEDTFILSGNVTEYDRLNQIPCKSRGEQDEFRYDTLSIIPYAQAAECGLEVYPDDTRIRCMQIAEQTRYSVHDILKLSSEELSFNARPQPDKSNEQYEGEVRQVIEDHIKKGNACNIVISTNITGTIAKMTPQKALTIFKNVLHKEFGAYMTFFFYDGKEYHIGASPERHITVDHGEVTMNPISGTYRKEKLLIDREAFMEFLRAPKEINELFMCVDEEIKQMAQMCEEGGRIVGPFLKEMSGLVHTEYLLIGRSQKDCIAMLRNSLHAPTVTGSPIKAATAVIKKIEGEPRKYYASEIVLLGHNEDGTEFLDSAITIRTMHVLPNGLISMRVGASIVRDSDPKQEAKEVHAKAGGMLRAIEPPSGESPSPQLPNIMDEEIQQILNERNVPINQFLFENQEDANRTVEELKGKTVTIIDFEDQFSFVLKHMIAAMGAQPTVRRFDEFDARKDTSDIVIVGSGPRDPRNDADPKMQQLGDITSTLLSQNKAFLSVCLGHQKLCEKLGMEVELKDEPSQGMQHEIDFFGTSQKLGFYNTFAATKKGNVSGIDICADSQTNEVFAVRGNNFSGFQFHPESIMSQNGFSILAEELKRILTNSQS